MIDLASAGVLYSESVLSLYPLLVKQLKTSLISQVFQRCVAYSLLALIVGGASSMRGLFSSIENIGLFFSLGFVNLAHVWTSYRAFQRLPGGAALTLFYTYPILNLIGAWLFFGEKIAAKSLPFFLIIMAGVYLLITAKGDAKIAPSVELDLGDSKKADGNAKEDGLVSMPFKDILAGLGAAITETAIYLLLYSRRKEKNVNMFTSVQRVYGSSVLLMIPALLAGKFDFIGGEAKLMGLWNGLLGFTGYAARFAAIPLVSPMLYSALSLFGIFAGYMWGFLFGKETISSRGLLGSGMVGVGIFLLKFFNGGD
jgi:drug/metabolite transporter (DMT)-like permease